MGNRTLLLLILFLASASSGLVNNYLPGSIAPNRAWFPLRNTDYSLARRIADSMLTVYTISSKVTKNISANRLEGSTIVDPSVCENISGNRIGETGEVFLRGKNMGKVSLKAFHLNWCDFYGALFETEYVPGQKFKINALFADALLVKGLFTYKVHPFKLVELSNEIPLIKSYFRDMDPQPFDFISSTDIKIFVYPNFSTRRLVLVNFEAGEGFSPGAVYLLEKKGNSYLTLSNYYLGEKAEILQMLVEDGDKDALIHAGTFGSGTEYIIIHYNGKEFEAIFKKKEGDFP